MAGTERPHELAVLPTGQLRVLGELEKPRPLGVKRSVAEARRLMPLTADLKTFRDLHSEIGQNAWPALHLAMCADFRPRWVPAGQLIFSGMHSMRQPLLILSGRAALLARPPPMLNDPPEEAALLGPGDCLTNASLTWLQPFAVGAIAQGDVQLLELPAKLFAQHLQMPLLQLLQRREQLLGDLPLLQSCTKAGLRGLAQAGQERTHASSAVLLEEGDPCDGLELLISGRATVTVKLAPKRKPNKGSAPSAPSAGEGGADTRADEAQIAEIHGPELLGVIDVMQVRLP